jgi:hypothetical protein
MPKIVKDKKLMKKVKKLIKNEIINKTEIIKNKEPLKTITIREFRNAAEYQLKTGWTFYDEEEKTVTSLHNRFNFLLLSYSLFLTSYCMVNNKVDKLTILIIGSLITFFLFIGLVRVRTRLIILLDILHHLDDKEVFPILSKEYHTKFIYKIGKRSNIYVFVIPVIMLVSFIVGIIYNACFK